jgi:23S rRNA (uracil1939-C5)-methyltransferase
LIGIESAASACADFAMNLASAPNVTLSHALAEQALAQVNPPIDVLVVDPPRAGLGQAVVAQILRLAPTTLAYISCDPATLARDARQLVAGGYQLLHMTPFDLFPQTYHIESISFWRQRSTHNG